MRKVMSIQRSSHLYRQKPIKSTMEKPLTWRRKSLWQMMKSVCSRRSGPVDCVLLDELASFDTITEEVPCLSQVAKMQDSSGIRLLHSQQNYAPTKPNRQKSAELMKRHRENPDRALGTTRLLCFAAFVSPLCRQFSRRAMAKNLYEWAYRASVVLW